MAIFNPPAFFNVLFIAILLCTFNAVASNDDYLKLLEGEAESIQLDKSGQLKDKEEKRKGTEGITKTNWSWEGDMEADVLPTGLAQDEFASILKQNFYGTFVFYRRLNSVDQETVYHHYTQKSPALESIRKDILSHLRN